MQAQILVVDDDDDNREVLVEILSEEYGSVVSAENGQQALDLIRSGRIQPDLILLDLRMPVMDGVTFLQHRAIDPKLGTCPVIVLTAEPSLLPDLAETVVAVLPKPVALARLLEIVRTICVEPEAQRARTRSMSRRRVRATRPPAGVERRRHSVVS